MKNGKMNDAQIFGKCCDSNLDRNKFAGRKISIGVLRLGLALGILFSFGELTSVAISQQESKEWGHLKGQIVFDGDVPKKSEIIPTKVEDVKYCKENKITLFDEAFVVDKETRGVRGVFVMLYLGRNPDEEGKKFLVHQSYDESQQETIIEINRMRFSPREIVVRVGQKVIFRNSDSVGHNPRFLSGKLSFSALCAAVSAIDISSKVTEADRLPQRMGCNMHEWVSGTILVRQTPYNVVTDSKGCFEIKNLPVGKHRFQFWKDRYLKLTDAKGEVRTDRRGVIEIEIKNGETSDLGKLSFSNNKTTGKEPSR